MEAAACRRCHRARRLTGDHLIVGATSARIRHWDGREQGLGIGMAGMREQLVGRADLDDLPEIHDGDPLRDVAHDAKVVGDEQECQVEFPLQAREEVEYLRLDRDIERGDGLVADDELGTGDERASETEPAAAQP